MVPGWREIARRLQVSLSVIVRLRQRFSATGQVQDQDQAGPGRTRTRQDQAGPGRTRQDQAGPNRPQPGKTATSPGRPKHCRNPLKMASEAIASGHPHHRRHRDLEEPLPRCPAPHLSSSEAAKGKADTHPQSCSSRLGWCMCPGRWTRQQWSQVVFTNQSSCSLEHPDGEYPYVQRRPGEGFREDCTLSRWLYGGGSVMVWGGFSTQHRTSLYHVEGNLTSQRFRDEILVPFTVPLLCQIGPHAVLQNDRPSS